MSSNGFRRFGTSTKGTRSFYERLRAHDNTMDIEDEAGQDVDDENLRENINNLGAENFAVTDSRLTVDSTTMGEQNQTMKRLGLRLGSSPSTWPVHDEEPDNDVPVSLLVESNDLEPQLNIQSLPEVQSKGRSQRQHAASVSSPAVVHPQRKDLNERSGFHHGFQQNRNRRPSPLLKGVTPGGPREKALWRWVNTSNLDSFMRDVYDYFDGGGIWCILVSNALWLLNTLFVAILLTFLTQCIEYNKIPHSRSLGEVVVPQCTRQIHGLWNLGIWMYTFFFIWKSVQYFLEIRRLYYIREFYVHLLKVPEQDMQTVSWQDIVIRIMALRDQNPKTASNIPKNLRRYMGSQSKDRLDAHDIANRLMRKENYLIAMINKDILHLTLPVPFFRDRQLFSKSMEWYLQFCILDMAFNELGQVQQDFLRPDRRGILSQKLKQRFYFAGLLNLLLAPVVLTYVVIVYFFTYYNEYQKDPKLATARKYTALAEWKFREFNELPHIFYERLHMSYPFATRYLDQFPQRMTEDIARSIAFMSGALTAVLAIGTILDSELFFSFEISKDRTVLFYLGIFGAIWALTRGMISEETMVFNPEYALRNVIDYTHYMPDRWRDRLHSFEVKREFSELYKMKVIIFLEEIVGIITTPLLLLFSLPKSSDQIVDFFREFTVHVDGLGYVCSFALFDFRRAAGNAGQQAEQDIREDYYATKNGKMAASYYGFLDNYFVNPKTGIPGHMPPGVRHQFYPPPSFPALNSPTMATDIHGSQTGGQDGQRSHSRLGGPRIGQLGRSTHAPSPIGSMLLDPRHQPSISFGTGGGVGGVVGAGGTKSLHRSRHPRGHRDSAPIEEEGRQGKMFEDEDLDDGLGFLEESTWETSPGQGLNRENSAAISEEQDTGVLGMINQIRQTHNRRAGVM